MYNISIYLSIYLSIYSILFYSILLYSTLLYSSLFSSLLFSSLLFYSMLCYAILFYSILFYSIYSIYIYIYAYTYDLERSILVMSGQQFAEFRTRLRCCYHLDDYLLVEHHETGGFSNKAPGCACCSELGEEKDEMNSPWESMGK